MRNTQAVALYRGPGLLVKLQVEPFEYISCPLNVEKICLDHSI